MFDIYVVHEPRHRHPPDRASRSPSGRSSPRCSPPSSTRRSSPPRCRRSPRDLGQLSDVSWVVTAYVVAAAATTPLWGKLGDRLGRKRLLELALVVFLLASALCGLAQWITMLVASRAAAGRRGRRADGAGHGRRRRPRLAARARPLPGLHRRDVRDRHGRRPADRRPARRPRAAGAGSSTSTSRSALAALAGLRARLPAAPTDRRRARRSTWRRRLLLAGATSALMLACIWGGETFAWGSATIVGLLLASVAIGARARRPRTPRRRPGRAAAPAAHAHRRRGERGAVPDDRGAVRDQRLRAAVPPGHDRRDADPGRAAARADDDRDRAVDERRRALDLPDRALPPPAAARRSG